MSEREFPEGISAFKPHEKAPDFVITNLSITRKDLGNWLRGKSDDKIRLQVLRSKKGTYYIVVDDFKPEKKQEATPSGEEEFDSDIPF